MELIENNSKVAFDGLQVFIDGKLFGYLRYNEEQKAWILWTDNSGIGTAYHSLLCDTMDAIEQEINNHYLLSEVIH